MQRGGPDSPKGWFVAFICCLISTMMFGSAGLSSMLFVAAISRYDTDRNKASFPFILCYILQAATGPFAGYFARRFSEPAVLVAGSVLAFVGIGACFFAETITEVAILWGVVFGAGFGFSTLLLPAIINKFFYKHRSKALGMSYLGSPIGFLIFPPIFEVLLNVYGLSGAFLFLCGINMQSVPLSLLLRQLDSKEDSINHPLNHSKEQFTHLNTNATITRQKSSNQNGEMKKTVKISHDESVLRRFSLEFLWCPPLSAVGSNEENKQYIFNLNKKCYGTSNERNDCVRSYEALNRSQYENLDKSCSVGHKTLMTTYLTETDNNFVDKLTSTKSGGRNTERKDPQRNFLYTVKKAGAETVATQPIDISKRSRKVMEKEGIAGTNVWNSTYIPRYNQFSTIYFGTCNTDRTTDSSNLKHNYHSKNSYGRDLHGNYQNTLIEPDEVNCIASTTSISLLITDATVNNKPESLEDKCLSKDCNSKGGKTTSIKNTCLLSVYCNPVFILMSIVNAMFNLQFSALTTVIIDFARDHDIDQSKDKFIMMCLSLMGACGMLGFGWVTDGGYLSRNRFASLLLFIGSVCTAVLPMTAGFTMLMVVLAFWCISQSSFVLLIPAIIAEYFDEDTQAVAVSACNVLCAPLYLIIPPLIGYFRDGQGSYDSIFYLLSALSLLNSAVVFTVPCIARKKNAASR